MPTRSRLPADDAEGARRDLTPMIDVVFLLIIFFLCIDFRVLEAKVPAHLPKDLGAGSERMPPRDELVVEVLLESRGTPVPRGAGSPTAGYRLEGHRATWRVGPLPAADLPALQAILGRAGARPESEDGPLPVVIRPGRGTTYGDVALTLDAVRAAGFDEVRFAAVR